MRTFQVVVSLVVAALVAAAVASCDGDGDPCEGGFVACNGGSGGTGGSGAAGGSGGAGGQTVCVVENCPLVNECRDAACIDNQCGFENHPDGEPCGAAGMLQCEGGVCQGCAGPDECSPLDCHQVACVSGACNYTVDAAAGCGPDGTGTCSPQGACALCDDGVKNGTETDVDCGGGCGATCTTGQACAAKADCESDSNECVDGVCCDSACGDPCFACSQPGTEGLCLPFAGPDAGACDGAQQCSPSGVCAKATGQSCSGESECATRLCDAGTCASCSDATPCADGQACVGGSCVPSGQPQGAPCSGPAACESGFCVDGVCCDAACDGACEACTTAYTQNQEGHCYFIISGYDPQSECDGSGTAGVCVGNGQCGQQ